MTTETFEFTMKDQAGSLNWLLEGATDLRDVESMGVYEWVRAYADLMIVGANHGDTSDREIYAAWLETGEINEVVKFLQDKINETKDEQTLEAIMTPKEIADEFGIKEDTVRAAIHHGWIPLHGRRKSGATWLVLRKYAKARWGNHGK